MIFDIVFIIFLILANGIFAMSEIAIISARKTFLQQQADEGNTKARIALELANNPNHFLSTVQVGITLVGIVAGAFGGARLSDNLAIYLQSLPLISHYASIVAFLIVVCIITYLSLIIGELVPKRIGLNNAERIAIRTAPLMLFISKFASPIVVVLSASTDAMVRLLGIHQKPKSSVTEEEINLMVQQGADAGVFEEAEKHMISSVFSLSDKLVSTVMTSRSDIVWFDLNEEPEVSWNRIAESGHSHFPVCRGSLDTVLGIASVKELWFQQAATGKKVDIKDTLFKPIFIPMGIPALKVLDSFKKTGRHIALVVDEYGIIKGLVTLIDVLEAIVGDVPSIDEPDEPQAVQREDGSWLLDGSLSIDEFKKLFHLKKVLHEEKEEFHTLAGFVMMFMKRIPTSGDHFVWNSLRFEVVDMDKHRIDKILVERQKKQISTSKSKKNKN